MEKVDYLDWLRTQEEFLLWELERPPHDTVVENECRDELLIVRDIKKIVEGWYGQE